MRARSIVPSREGRGADGWQRRAKRGPDRPQFVIIPCVFAQSVREMPRARHIVIAIVSDMHDAFVAFGIWLALHQDTRCGMNWSAFRVASKNFEEGLPASSPSFPFRRRFPAAWGRGRPAAMVPGRPEDLPASKGPWPALNQTSPHTHGTHCHGSGDRGAPNPPAASILNFNMLFRDTPSPPQHLAQRASSKAS